jgi:subtilisin family serine protease
MRLARAATALALAMVLLPPVAAANPPADPPADPPAAAPPSAVPAESWTVTLLTGDVVRVTRDGAGAYAAEPAGPVGQPPRIMAVGEHLYVIPESVASLVPRVLDPALFDVRLLVAEQLDDARATGIPLLVESLDARALQAAGGLVVDRVLPRTGIATATAPKAQTAGLGTRLAESTAGIGRIWLDRKVAAVWDENLEQIGAPQAWAGGADGRGVKLAVLDTGADATHPDLAGRVAGSADFTGKGTIADGHGHGTHVAAIAAGNGAGNDGLRKGVAPGAELLVGKVLGDTGTGQTGWVLAGMEWAAAQGADVVSMSLTGSPTDGSDPLSVAVDRLTAAGTLFVIAAGNDGPDAETVGTPGSADAALTVAAVDGDDEVAAFSSRGPRAGDGALKPDLAAPGVNIVAARAAGTSMGTPVDASYTSASGTSMATPSVAGAAALVLQRRPELTPAEVKAVLAGTAHRPAGATPTALGAGRLDLVHALGSTVRPDDEDLDLGLLRFPQTGPVTGTAGWTNDGGEAVTLDLELSLAVPAGAATLSTTTLTVPPGGHGTVSVTVDPTRTVPGAYGGYLTATVAGTGARLSTPVGFVDEGEMYDLTVRGVDETGAPARWQQFTLYDIGDLSRTGREFWYLDQNGVAVLRRPKGHYLVETRLSAQGADDTRRGSAVLVVPEVHLSGDTTVVLDTRNTEPVRDTVAGRSTETHSAEVLFTRTDGVGETLSYWTAELGEQPLLLSRQSPPVTVGRFDTSLSTHLVDRRVRLFTAGRRSTELRTTAIDRTVLPAAGSYRVADLGRGTAEDFAAAGELSGRLALVRRGEPLGALRDRATAAGAAVLAIRNDRPGTFGPLYSPQGRLPMVVVDGNDAEGLDGVTELRIATEPYSAFSYDLNRTRSGDYPRPLAAYHSPSDQQRLARVDAHYPPGEVAVRSNFGLVAGLAPLPVGRTRRTEYVTPGAALRTNTWWTYPRPGHKFNISDHGRTYRPRERAEVHWFSAPAHATIGGYWNPPVYRGFDTLNVSITALTDGDRHGGTIERTDGGPTATNTLRLYRDGSLVAERTGFTAGLPLAAGPARYRLESVTDAAAVTPLGTRTESAWEFDSARSPDGSAVVLPLPVLDYDLPTSGDAGLCGLTTLTGRRVSVRVLPQPALPAVPAPAVHARDVRLSYSTDDGTGWRPVARRGPVAGDVARFDLPLLPRGSTVSLRTEVLTTAGVRLDQRIIRAAVTGKEC